MLTIDHEAFKEKEKEKKEREKEMKNKGGTASVDPKTRLAELEAALNINAASTIELKTSFDDFKSGNHSVNF